MARRISDFSANHVFDADEIEVNALDSGEGLRLHHVLVLNLRSGERPEAENVAAVLMGRGVVSAYVGALNLP